jgi:hypothetical protein
MLLLEKALLNTTDQEHSSIRIHWGAAKKAINETKASSLTSSFGISSVKPGVG